MSLIKSKLRVAAHGEVFTPSWLVQRMLDLVKPEAERIDARFLEPACGSGNFLVAVLALKLETTIHKYRASEFEMMHYALLSLMSVYGIELLTDNVAECRRNLLNAFSTQLSISETDVLYKAARYVLSQNIVRGDALTMETNLGNPICFPEWGYVGNGKYQRRDFRFRSLTRASKFNTEGTLFSHLEKHEIFVPEKVYPLVSMAMLSKTSSEDFS